MTDALPVSSFTSKATPKGYIRAGYLLIILTFGGIGGWAATTQIDSAVVASGAVALEGDSKVVQHLVGGIIQKILVKEADDVEIGDVLIVLEGIEARSNVELYNQRSQVAQAVEARLLAEQNFLGTIDFPQRLREESSLAVEDMLRDQQNIFDDRRSIMASQTEILNFRLEQLHLQVDGLKLQKDALERRIALQSDLLERLQEGEEKGVIESNRLVERQDTLIQIQANLGEVISEISKVRGATGEARLNLIKLKQEFRERSGAELKEVRIELAEISERLKVAKDTLERTSIRATSSGTVQNVAVHTVGSIIKSGEILMEIVPDDAVFLIEAQVSPLDIDNVSPGLKTEVRFGAFKTKLTTIILGQVQSVSNNVITPQNPNIPPYYLARIHIEESDIPNDIRDRLTAGMPADVVIVSGERSVLNYIISPLMDAVSISMLEE